MASRLQKRPFVLFLTRKLVKIQRNARCREDLGVEGSFRGADAPGRFSDSILR